MRYAGHALRHASLFDLVVKCAVCVLETSVTVKQRMRAGVGLDCLVEGLEYQRIVVVLTYDKGDDTTVV